jgi:hypothetical protein
MAFGEIGRRREIRSATVRPDAVVNSSSSEARSPATSAKGGASDTGRARSRACPRPRDSARSIRLPFESSTGYLLSATIVTVYRASASGRSWKKAMRRNPSASHCVQNTPEDRYKPSSARLAAGSHSETMCSTPVSGSARKVMPADDSAYSPRASGRPSRLTSISFSCSPQSRSVASGSAAGFLR